MPAIKDLLALYQNYTLSSPTADNFSQMIEYAKRGHDIDPTDKQMAAAGDLLTAQKWMANFAVSDDEIKDVITDMRNQLNDDPTNSQLAVTIAQVLVRQGQKLERQSASQDQPKAATDEFDSARQLFEKQLDPKAGGQDKNPSMHFRYAQILMYLIGCDESKDGNPKKDADAAWGQINQARALATDKDHDFLAINDFAAQLSEERQDHDGALKIYRSLPVSLSTQVDLAKSLGRSRNTEAEPHRAETDRAEAEGIVRSEMDSLKDSESNQVTGVRIVLLQLLTDFQIDDYADPNTDSTTKAELHDTIQGSLAKLDDAVGSRFVLDIKRLGARFRYVSHDWPGVIDTVTSMVTADPSAGSDYTSLFTLADAYDKTHQTGVALNTYGRLIELFPHEIRPRILHAKLQESINPTLAQSEIEELEKMDPDDPQIKLLRMGLVMTDPEHPSDDAIASFKAFPEATYSEVVIKARAAMVVHQYDDAVRLFNTLISMKDPPDPNIDQDYVFLAQSYFRMGNKQAAQDAAARGLTANPNNSLLKQLVSSLNGEAPSARAAIREEAATQVSDPVTREIRLAQLAGERNDLQEQESDLKAAEAAATGDVKTQVWEAMFNFYLSSNRLADAADLMPKLVAANADSAGGRMYDLKLSEAQGNYAHALEVAKSLGEDRADYASTYVAYGDVLLGQSHLDEAVAEYEVALQKQSNSLEAYEGLIRCSYQQGKVADALRYIQEGLKMRPGDPHLRDLLITHHLNYGDPADAINVLSDEIRDDPNSPRLQSAMIDVLLRVAAARTATDPQTASQALQEALKRSNDGVARWPDDDAFYVSLSDTYQRMNRPADAGKALLTFAARDQWKDSPYPLAKLSQFYEDNKQPDKAEAEMRTALDISKNRLDVEMDYGGLLVKHKKFDECLALLKGVNPDAPAIRNMRIRILWGAGRQDQAQAEFNADMTGNPPDEVALRSAWGRMLMDGGKYAAALEQANRVLAINPNNLEAYFTRGYSTLHIQPTDVPSAVQDLVKYVGSPNALDRTRARMELAQAYLSISHNDEAEAQLSMAMHADPANVAARMKMVELLSNGSDPRYMQALDLLREVDTVEPYKSNADVFRNEAVLYHQLRDLNNALACSETALRLRPLDEQAGDMLLDILLEANRYQDVLDISEKMPSALQRKWWVLCKRSQAQKALGNQAGALSDAQGGFSASIATHDSASIYAAALSISQSLGLAQAIAILEPHAQDDLACQLTLATFYQSNGNDLSAVATADAAVSGISQQSHDDQVRIVSTAAQIYQSVKPQPLVDKAFDTYQKWVNLEPNNAAALNNLAWMLMEDYSPPKVTDAAQYMKKALDLLPPNSDMDISIEDTEGWLLILSGSAAEGVDLLNKVVDAKPSPETYLHLAQGYVQMQLPKAGSDHAKLGLDMINKQNPKDQDAALKAKLQDLITQCDQLQKANQPAQAQ
jgi:tetratricopeptide (TPR) repeat protein